ncbi:hypothetical protein Hanom_Chr14g01283861 [Helianthus anomalus]
MSGFDSAEPYFGDESLHVGNGMALPILHIGSQTITSPNKTFYLKDILHVPTLKRNLLSVQKFCQDNNVYFEFHATFFSVKDKHTHYTLLTGPSEGGLYSIKFPIKQPIPKVAFSTTRATTTTWHQRLGHPHSQLSRLCFLNTVSLFLQKLLIFIVLLVLLENLPNYIYYCLNIKVLMFWTSFFVMFGVQSL